MTRAQIYTLLTDPNGLLSGVQIDETIFENLLDIVQMQVEGVRPWVWIRDSDATQTASPGDTFTTQKTLAATFSTWYEESALRLVDVNNNELTLLEVPYADRFKYRNTSGRFAVDYPNSKFYLLGTITQSYTIYQNFIKVPTLVSSDASASWVFPVRFHKILALMVAVLWRKGIDYDVFNNVLGDNQASQAKMMLDIMTRWDSELQANMQRGKDPFDSNSIGSGSTNGGAIAM